MIRILSLTFCALLALLSPHAEAGRCNSGDCEEGYGTYTYDSGDTYTGYWKDGSRHGTGTYNYKSSGNRYEGDWVSDVKQGQGTYSFANGDEYRGAFVNNDYNGFGIYRYASSGNRYEGQWKDDQKHGKGTYYFATGDRYEGDFALGDYNGWGTYYYKKSGNRYEGQWVSDKKQGWGTYYFANGDRYTGEFYAGDYNGKGTYNYASSGKRYEGEWQSDQKHGHGTMYLADGSIDQQGLWTEGSFTRSLPVNIVMPVPPRQPGTLIAQQTAPISLPTVTDRTPPTITLQRGINIVNTATQTIRGQAEDASGVAIVSVNGMEAALDAQGNFSVDLLLRPGENEVSIAAMDVYRNQANKTFTITRNAATAMPVTPLPVNTGPSLNPGAYYALIIGVQEYSHPSVADLAQPVRDARSLKAVLETNYTFESANIRLLENPTRGQILDELDALALTLTERDNLLIFYAGHGYWDAQTEQGYWLPSDARNDRRRDWIANGTIVDYINGIKSKHTLLISDACFSGGIFKTRSAFSDAPGSANALYSLPSRKAMTSGTLTEVPDKSVFVEYLAKRLETNPEKYTPSEQLFSSFRTAVINNSPTNQVPQFGEIRQAGDEGGDFIFVRR